MTFPAPASASTSSPRPRVALIGISGYGSIYLALARAARDRGEIDLVAAVVINPDEERANEAELAARGCRIFRAHGAMLQALHGALDLCLIPTGIQWHARMAIAAMEAGAHVLVEKPLAGSFAETELIRASERATGRWVAVGFQDLYCRVNRWVKAEILRGAIGTLQSVRFLGLWPRSSSYFSRNHWAGRLEADGVPVRDSLLNNAFAHFVNLGLYFLGGGAQQSAEVTIDSAELYRAHAIETFDTSVVLARTAAGAAFWVGASHSCERTLEPIITVTGSQGVIEWRHGEYCRIRTADGRDEQRDLPDIEATREQMFADVLQKLRDPAVQVCDTALAQVHTRFIESVHAAGAPSTLPPEAVDWTASATDARRWPVVRGLEAALLRAHERGTTLAAAGFNAPAAPRSALS